MKPILATGLLLAGIAFAQAAHTVFPIRSRAALTSYLETAPSRESPLNALSPGARKRFLASLRFGSRGITSFDTSDLAEELDRNQVRRILAMFGLDAELSTVHVDGKPLRGSPEETPLERRFDRFYIGSLANPAAASLRASYDALLADSQKPKLLARASAHEVDLLFRAATRVAWTAPTERYLRDARMDLDELAKRGFAGPQRVAAMHHLLVTERKFDTADALARQFPHAGIEALPPLRGMSSDGSPTALLIRPDGSEMFRKPVRMDVPLRIIVVAGCHLSEDAARTISHDPDIGRLFHGHAIWLASDTESLSDVAEWNRKFPGQPMHVAWRDDEWNMLSDWDIPTFYVFEHGKLVDRWSGWAGGAESMRTLRTHLRADGVLPR